MVCAAQEGLTLKKWDGDGVPLEESNCAEIGSDADKAARKAAAQTEEAWVGVGQAVGIQIWRIEQFKVVAWPTDSYGEFYSGDSYIILETYKEEGHDKLRHTIFFWLGEKTTIDEMGTAAYKTVELDDLMDGEPTQRREVQNYESDDFKKLFPRLKYLEGGVESGFTHVTEGAYQSKLLQVRKTRNGMLIKEVTLARDSMNQGDCFILDTGAKIYVWCGKDASPYEKAAANDAAENLERERDGQSTATHDIDDAFWQEIGGDGSIKPASEASDRIPEPEIGEGVLYMLEDTTGELKMTEVARGDLGKDMLDSENVMMLDTETEIMLWVGSKASPGESRNAMSTAMAYLKKNNKPSHTPIHLFKEGNAIKNETWKKTFASGSAVTKTKSSPPPEETRPAAAPRKSVEERDAAAGIMTLAELLDPAVWKAKGCDPSHREQHLSDEEFQKVFDMSKADFAKLPQWKRDAAKKKHDLF